MKKLIEIKTYKINAKKMQWLINYLNRLENIKRKCNFLFRKKLKEVRKKEFYNLLINIK